MRLLTLALEYNSDYQITKGKTFKQCVNPIEHVANFDGISHASKREYLDGSYIA
jgi:hypothetical protein